MGKQRHSFRPGPLRNVLNHPPHVSSNVHGDLPKSRPNFKHSKPNLGQSNVSPMSHFFDVSEALRVHLEQCRKEELYVRKSEGEESNTLTAAYLAVLTILNIAVGAFRAHLSTKQ